MRVDEAWQYFLMRGATLVSPSGTEYRLELHNDTRPAPEGFRNVVFRTTGFLGEDTQGDWQIKFSRRAAGPRCLFRVAIRAVLPTE